MDTLKQWFLEDPTYVYIALAVVELILAAAWYYRRSGQYGWALLVPVILAGGVIALDRAVETDREQIRRTVREIAAEFSQGGLDIARKCIDETYHGFGGNKAKLLGRAEDLNRQRHLKSVKIKRCRIDVSGRRAEMEVTTVIHLSDSSAGGGVMWLLWKVNWVKRPEGWRIERLSDPTSVVPGFSG